MTMYCYEFPATIYNTDTTVISKRTNKIEVGWDPAIMNM